MEEIRGKYPCKTIWIYTGNSWEDIYELPFIAKADVVVDGEYMEDLRNVKLQWKGSSNQRVIDVQATLASGTPEIPILHCEDYYDAAGKAQQILTPACGCCS